MDSIKCSCGNDLMLKGTNGNVTIQANIMWDNGPKYQCTKCGKKNYIPNDLSKNFGVSFT